MSSNGDFELLVTDFYGVIYFGDKLNQRYLDILDTLSRRLKIVCFTNAPKVFLETFSSLPELSIVSEFYSAIELNISKSDSESYTQIAKDNDADPARSIFIDDVPSYVKVSEQAGFTGINYVSNNQLLSELKAIGVNYK